MRKHSANGVGFMASGGGSGNWAALLLAVLGVVLLSDPKCTRGCRTVAEHLLAHGIEGVFSA
jgi:hypothetical protein